MTPLDSIARIRAQQPRIAVLGDFLLDRWWHGTVDRVAREAPAPVVELAGASDLPGGAANTARNLSALGARVRAFGAIGADEPGDRLRERLTEADVDVRALQRVAGARTTTKARVSVADQVLIRLDDTQREPWPEQVRRQLLDDLAEALAECDALVICDYGAALLDDAMISALAALPRAALLVVDAHDPARWAALRPDVITPNAGETERLLGERLGSGEDRVAAAAAAGDALRRRSGAEAVVVTLDRTGTVLLTDDAPPHRTRAHAAPEQQASGAGDVFVSALSVARAAGCELPRAVELAQLAADIAVERTGTCRCSLDELELRSSAAPDPQISVAELAERLDVHRRAGDRIVFTNGCFDVLHRGHTASLKQARRLGDVLVVALNSDDSARRLKGPGRPVNGVRDRANVLAELSCVDYVTVFDDDTACATIRELRPDVYAKGGDYTPEMLEEAAEVRRAGGEVVILDYVPDHSTTELIDRLRTTAEA
ncbi:D-glycero-beta-D-manno-heptose 1-phosphate adenylyltransferase [Leucobacter chromiiresistens]|uniref:Bifunctional protein HldE n=3 Tax=Leucobacter chromiiresistens TaxID=1079994 RepID=A0A1H0ZBI2_9MICO|nr:D-glycero-beta-D-manno-heptose 1-phosphate adenylyltransferase [Leucobacter chromiiresistens]SDQ24778.1 rfaE bifunctional protein, domain I/rfaE bifunctional protein, domain II [Leucobacter chromiiresistens]